MRGSVVLDGRTLLYYSFPRPRCVCCNTCLRPPHALSLYFLFMFSLVLIFSPCYPLLPPYFRLTMHCRAFVYRLRILCNRCKVQTAVIEVVSPLSKSIGDEGVYWNDQLEIGGRPQDLDVTLSRCHCLSSGYVRVIVWRAEKRSTQMRGCEGEHDR